MLSGNVVSATAGLVASSSAEKGQHFPAFMSALWIHTACVPEVHFKIGDFALQQFP